MTEYVDAKSTSLLEAGQVRCESLVVNFSSGNARSATSFQTQHVQSFQVLLVFSSLPMRVQISPVENSKVSKSRVFLKTDKVLTLRTTSSDSVGLGMNCAAGRRLCVFDIGVHFD